MKDLVTNFRKIYRPVILPIGLLVAIFYLLILPIENGDVIEFILQPWGLAMVLMIISVIYIENIFTTPKDALVNSLNTLIISIVFWETSNINFWIASVFSASILVSGIVFLIIYDKHRKINLLSKFASYFGKAKILFPIIAVLSFVEFVSIDEFITVNVNSGILYLLLFYLLFLLLTNHDIIDKIKDFPLKFLNILQSEDVGVVKGNLTPNIILVEFNSRSGVKINDLIVVGNHDVNSQDFEVTHEIEERIGLIIDFIGAESERNTYTARVYMLNEPQQNLRANKSGLIKLNQECKKIINPDAFVEKVDSEKIKHSWNRREDIVAFTTSFSNINVLKGEIVRQQQLENAQLVSCVNKDVSEPIRYQIIDAETRKETQEDKNDFGYTQFMAYQLGEWRKPKNDQNVAIANAFQRFFEFQWVPSVNSLIFRWNDSIDSVGADDSSIDKSGYYLLGTIPKTNLPIYLDIRDLVSHHTAILGVTGTGKTTMVHKLIKQIKENDIFTVCLDITGEYRDKISDFQDFFDKDTNDKWVVEVDKIIDARKRTQYGFNDPKKLTKEDAEKIEDDSIKEINKIIKQRIGTLRANKKVVILEIPEISNTYFSLDFTQYVIQAILQYAKEIYVDNLSKKDEDKDNFQCCLVLEEAHTLVPENLGVGGDFGASKAVIDKISQIALQGRKYRVGFVLVSQRTATVKKTVLNQCNTMIAFRAYDETSFTFLSNYFGDEYVREIIHLKNDGDSRYVIVSGKAVVADRPIIVEVKK
ncbi:MAG: hypothetical protein UT53_C0008G0004 [Candidatus Yanofskybacteria bacterium GW2011_GWD2_39_48]|uniref:AAA+ ATPase domain-containing protein n=1 Tax=Candidatus Yanofskybacteria bacterium GW2011_GWD2_39_48 TaxID=1619031 RepID=A0A0G0P678_9BACT|nr:MAG: hypothetical protein UT53_C0008G0004 [Candidatus Yanofskybacteria bacterium GW2011_GWD2_39_48]